MDIKPLMDIKTEPGIIRNQPSPDGNVSRFNPMKNNPDQQLRIKSLMDIKVPEPDICRSVQQIGHSPVSRSKRTRKRPRTRRKHAKQVRAQQLMDIRVTKNVQPIRLSLADIKCIVPPFDPTSSNGLCAAEWVETIESLRLMYNWDDRITLLYATLRLEGLAKKWFNENLCQWTDLRVKLVGLFPHTSDKAEVFAKLVNRRKEDDETFEKYVSDIHQMAKECKVDLDSTIRYIIGGIIDAEIRTHLKACNVKTIPELLAKFGCFRAIQRKQCLQIGVDRASSPAAAISSKRVQYCFKCQQPGHIVSQCKSNVKGKRSSEQIPYEEPTKKISANGKINDDCSDLLKIIKVDDIHLTAFVNLCSEHTTMQRSEFEKYDWKMQRCDGASSTKAIGKITKNVGAGEVEMLTDILIVEDDVQDYTMILGRNFLHRPQVCVIKTYRSLKIKYDDSEEGNITAKSSFEEEEILELLDIIERDCL